MLRSLPSLTSLKAFEAAGRRLSFTLAAEELGVTQAAISHQVKSLEKHLGITLFTRRPRNLRLTAAGKRLLPSITQSLDDMLKAVSAVRTKTLAEPLSVRSPPTFAARWLSPRLHDFREKHPGIDLRINHSNRIVDFANEDIDLAVSYGDGRWPGVETRELLRLDFFPVCAPHCLQGAFPLSDPQNLARYNLLHDAGYENWERWLALAELDALNARRGTILDDTNVLIQAAVDGQGIAMCSGVFVAELLDRGALVRPFERVLESELAYHAVCPAEHLRRPQVQAFRQWLLEQAASRSP